MERHLLDRSKRKDGVHVRQEQNPPSASPPAGDDLVPGQRLFVHFDQPIQAGAFLDYDFADAVDGGFIVRGGFRFNQPLEQTEHVKRWIRTIPHANTSRG
jgi:hypothetical protein